MIYAPETKISVVNSKRTAYHGQKQVNFALWFKTHNSWFKNKEKLIIHDPETKNTELNSKSTVYHQGHFALFFTKLITHGLKTRKKS